MSYSKAQIADLCTLVTSGGTPLTSVPAYYDPKEIPWLKTGEVNYCRIYDTESYISKEGLACSSAKLIPVNSVIIAMYGQGDTAGRVAINKIPLSTNQACCNLVINHEIADYEYVYYALSTLYDHLVALKNGGAQPNLNAKKIKAIEIPLPDLETQHKIASVLGAYDALIENNQKQIKLLEEAAQRLYKEWFVDLHFPGYENTRIVDGVPEGWKKGTVGDVIDFNPKMSLIKDRLKQSVPMSALSTKSMVININEYTTTYSNSGSKFKDGDTLLARITPCLENGKTGFVSGIGNDGAVGSTEFIVMRSKALNPYIVYLLARTDDFRKTAIHSMTGSDGRQRAQIDKIMKYPYLIPSQTILDSFENILKPIFNKIIRMNEQSQKLALSRDRLLPKLMNGEIEV